MANNKVLKILRDKFGKAKAASGGNYRVSCPTCEAKDSKKMKRYISPDWPMSNCFICGKLLKVNEILSTSNFEFQSAVSDGPTNEDEYPHAKIPPFKKIEMLQNLPEPHPAIQFLKKDYLENFDYYSSLDVGFIPLDGGSNISFDSGFTINTGDSLYFPVHHGGELVGWQLRFVPGTVNGDRLQYMRYLHLFPKGNYLFNYDMAKKYGHVIVVEGAKKALKSVNSVATLGKGISSTQKQLIQEWKKITLILDGEDNTQEQARELAEEFNFNGRQCINIDPREYGFQSPDEATSEQLKNIVTKLWTR
jgi:hypothetical protein